MNIVVINDCRDENAKGRQCARISQLFNSPVNFIGVSSDIEASGNLIDALDAFEGKEGLVLVNVAPRNGIARKYQNGTPFGFFCVGQTLVVSSVSGYTLSLIKKLGLASQINLFPPETIFDELGLSAKKDTQFRSYELTPKIARAILEKKQMSTSVLPITEVPDLPNCVWWVDCFGNLKTNFLSEEVNFLSINDQRLEKFSSLRSVPDDELAIVPGSSGFQNKRFLEIVINGGSATHFLGIQSGSWL